MEFLAALHLYINFVWRFLKIPEKEKKENRYKWHKFWDYTETENEW